MPLPVRLPELGAAARVSAWFAEPGDYVYAGDRLVEVVLPSATFDVSAPASGRLVERHCLPPDAVTAGQTLGVLEPD